MKHLYEHEIELRWRDHDALDHVNNAVFLTYLEEARLAWLRRLPVPWFDERQGPVVARIEIDFRRPLTWPGRVRIALALARRGTSSLTLAHRMWRPEAPEETVCEALVVLVWIDRKSGRSLPIPRALIEWLEREAG